jgi:UDP-GlcNAc:undecaprenyl-phosphate GlcNAc-1-phosphate transferase
MTFLTALLISMFIAITMIPILKGLAIKMHLVDMPAQRKVHSKPMPKIGGLAMAVAILVPSVFWLEQTPFIRAVLLGAGVLVLFGVADDLKELGYKVKLTGQIAAAAIVVFEGGVTIHSFGDLLPVGVQLPNSLIVLLTVVVIVGVTNAINLSDGLDGLAGGISMLSFLCIGYLAYAINDIAIALIAISVIGAIFGFLRFNTYPATIFMGDTGSQLLGFLAITLSLRITQGVVPYSPLLPLILLGFPILDTLAVMTERIASGKSPFVADKNHFHHKLIRLGLFHTEAVFVIYVLQALFVTSAFFLRFRSEWVILTICCVFSGTIIIAFVFADRLGWQLKRYDLFDRVVKGKLKLLKEKHILIKVSFRVF